MPDIFISYSRKDSEQAMQLVDLLSSAGLSCWIDREGIDLATSWSAEIVDAIDQCKAFVLLVSSSSAASHNVAKELALASERRKKILPLDLEPIELPREFAYQLAGIQRAPMTNIDSIIRALGKLGLEATGAPQPPKIARETDGRLSLMILPFEDLSPTADNGWFADGLGSELISALSNVKALRVADPQATKEFKRYQGTLPKYAHEMSIRYFVQGDVRKFGDQIKITTRLLDIESGDFLWQDSMKGTMEDIFDIQEKVADRVVEGLKVHLDSGEKKKLAERGTENPEAYELFLKAEEYHLRQNKEGQQLAGQLAGEAIRLDPKYARAYRIKASALLSLFRDYDRDPTRLDEAEALCYASLRLKPDHVEAYAALSQIHMYRDQFAEAQEAAMAGVRINPQNHVGHFALGFFYSSTGEFAKAIPSWEEAVRLKPEDLTSLWNLIASYDSLGDRERCAHWSRVALPLVERYLKLHPGAEGRRVRHALLLFFSGRTEDANLAAKQLTDLKDSNALFNAATLFGELGDKPEALRTVRKAIETGYRNIRALTEFLTGDKEGIRSLQGTPEYDEVKLMVQRLEAETARGSSTGEPPHA